MSGAGPRPRRHGGDADPHEHSIPPSYFDGRYAESPDPWNLSVRWYERRKYDLTLASLPRRRYASGYEPACSIGVLTRGLAGRCDRLLAVDSAPVAVEAATAALADSPHVSVRRSVLPRDLPDASFDLVVLSEFLYYFAPDDLELLSKGLGDRLRPGGHVVCVHRRSTAPGQGWDGFNAHRVVEGRLGLDTVMSLDDPGFEIVVLERRKG
ncbi:SAM-dependent methyltransferase [Nocardiopsis sp. NPDC101807]|uniref:SAM-dependent methyltransferase n=1 Tax=Nocardiopsis sp. NPDC101807 TaxID=3364339 RepID=UPI003818E3EE